MFNTTRNNITMHIQNIFDNEELEEKSVSKKFLLTASDGKNYKTYQSDFDKLLLEVENKN